MVLHDYCARYAPPPTLLLYALHDAILVMAILCKGQLTEGLRGIALRQAGRYMCGCEDASIHRRLIYKEHTHTRRGNWSESVGVSPGRLTRGPVLRNKPHPRPWWVPYSTEEDHFTSGSALVGIIRRAEFVFLRLTEGLGFVALFQAGQELRGRDGGAGVEPSDGPWSRKRTKRGGVNLSILYLYLFIHQIYTNDSCAAVTVVPASSPAMVPGQKENTHRGEGLRIRVRVNPIYLLI